MFVWIAGVQILHILVHHEHLQQRGQGAGDTAHPLPPPLSQLVHQVRGAPDIKPVLCKVRTSTFSTSSHPTVLEGRSGYKTCAVQSTSTHSQPPLST